MKGPASDILHKLVHHRTRTPHLHPHSLPLSPQEREREREKLCKGIYFEDAMLEIISVFFLCVFFLLEM